MNYERMDNYEQNLCNDFYISSTDDSVVYLYGGCGVNDAYLAGLFDGEGCVTYSNKLVLRKGKKKAYPYWRIVLEISMTHEATITAAHEMFNCGTVRPRAAASHQNLPQWRWRCCHRDALQCARRLVPYSITKKEKLESIIKHYAVKDRKILGDAKP